MKKIREFIGNNGWWGVLRVLMYPVTMIVTGPFVTLRSLYACRTLITKTQGNYLHFSVYSSINCLFYKTRWLNIHRYGLTGTSPHIGPGNVNLARNFHYPLIALRLFVNAGATTILVCMLVWLMSHALWIEYNSWPWTVVVIILTLSSTYWHTCTFKQMNYNALGWMFFPAFIYFLHGQNSIYASMFLLLVSFGSTTAAVIGITLICGLSLVTFSPYTLFICIPALIKLSTHLLPLLSSKNRASAKTLKQGIGATKKVKYKRTSSLQFGVTELYQLILFIQFGTIYYLIQGEMPWLLMGGIGLFIINSKFVRFADVQSMYMTMLSTGVPLVLLSENNLLVLSSFWIFCSPIPRIIGFYSNPKVLDILPKSSPYNLDPVLAEMKNFLAVIPDRSTLFLAFKHPKNIYENIYDGYRALVEPISYICNLRYIHMIPDWWYINENNYETAQDFWGVQPEEVIKNMYNNSSKYVVIYEDEKNTFHPSEWINKGFTILNELDWEKFSADFVEHKHLRNARLKWHLLEWKKTNIPSPSKSEN